MSTNTQTQQNPLWEAILKNCGANAINVADSYYNKVTREVGDSLDKLRKNTVASITAGVKASFAIASAMLMASLVEAASQLAGAYGSKAGLNDINSAEKDLKPFQNKANNFDKNIEDLNKKLKASPGDKKLTDNLAKRKTERDENKTLLDKKQTNMKSISEKAQMKSQMWSLTGQGAATIPKSLGDAEQTKGRAITDVLQTLVGMLSSTYQKSNETLKNFFDTDYLGGLVALGQIQLR
ncbi:MAG: hypothetical protein K1060chlam4_00424 [Candidatus Anoxychlamydiales bacterium]|nr:hypothetical protein [Candidatus Anoxychlamydiales bacterium]